MFNEGAVEEMIMPYWDEENSERFDEFMKDASDLRGVYWNIRMARFHRDERKWYRRALREKIRLIGLGYDSELIRLFCLWKRRPHSEVRERRFFEYFDSLPELPKQLTLF
jgi:hypothetical protein